MMKLISSIACTALVTMLSLVWIPAALGKQQCSASVPSNSQGYWSWRMIDGRKCWYEGKPMLSKSSLEWSAQPAVKPDAEDVASAVTEKPANPLDAQARVMDSDSRARMIDRDTFDA